MSIFGNDLELNDALAAASAHVISGIESDLDRLERGKTPTLIFEHGWFPRAFEVRVNSAVLAKFLLCAQSIADKLATSPQHSTDIPGCVGEEIAMWAIERATLTLQPARTAEIEEAFSLGYWDTDFLRIFHAGGEIDLYNDAESSFRMPAHVPGELQLSEWWKPFEGSTARPEL